jgi:succinate dehydrogenase / fumarate reductase iron-sulfur subunit
MRLRRRSGSDFDIEDRNNGYRHEHAFVKNIRRNGLLHENDLLADSYGGKFSPNAAPELASSLLNGGLTAMARGKVTLGKALLHPHKTSKEFKRLFDEIDGREKRNELNLYISGVEDEPAEAASEEREPPAEPSAPTTEEA